MQFRLAYVRNVPVDIKAITREEIIQYPVHCLLNLQNNHHCSYMDIGLTLNFDKKFKMFLLKYELILYIKQYK